MTHLLQIFEHDPVKFLTEVVAGCSVLHTILPPFGWKPDFVETGLADFPGAQAAFYGVFHSRWYKLLIYIVGYVALNGRSTVWRVISMKNPNGLNSVTISGTTKNNVTNGGKQG